MPEAYALRKFYWQLFVTLTFIRPPRSRPASLPPVRRWLRVVARMASVHFERLIWVVRFEVGKRGDCGHYHLCLAGIPRALLCIHFCRELESAWRTCGGGLSQVALYDQARDGLGIHTEATGCAERIESLVHDEFGNRRTRLRAYALGLSSPSGEERPHVRDGASRTWSPDSRAGEMAAFPLVRHSYARFEGLGRGG